VRAGRGEIDIVARDGDTLVFVEVKTRRRGEPAEAVTPEKQRQVVKTAQLFLARHQMLDSGIRCRYDIVAVVWPEGSSRGAEVTHFPAAFDAPADG
jgi:putative endonuclease